MKCVESISTIGKAQYAVNQEFGLCGRLSLSGPLPRRVPSYNSHTVLTFYLVCRLVLCMSTFPRPYGKVSKRKRPRTSLYDKKVHTGPCFGNGCTSTRDRHRLCPEHPHRWPSYCRFHCKYCGKDPNAPRPDWPRRRPLERAQQQQPSPLPARPASVPQPQTGSSPAINPPVTAPAAGQ